MKTLFLFSILIIFSVNSFAQNISMDEQAANFLRESGKLYVVIAVLVTIFAGIIIFLIIQDRKISKLEKKLNDRDKHEERKSEWT